jgi:hypothetical protein
MAKQRNIPRSLTRVTAVTDAAYVEIDLPGIAREDD